MPNLAQVILVLKRVWASGIIGIVTAKWRDL
jgi:hypothetical protein